MRDFDERPPMLPPWKLAILKHVIGVVPCVSLTDGGWHLLKPGTPPDGRCTVERYVGPEERAYYEGDD